MNFFRRDSATVEWIIVFLGNPGQRYANTRHNAGFMAADALAVRRGVKIDRLKHRSLTVKTDFGGHKMLLMKPQTYMNLSGEAVVDAMRFYKVPLERVLAVSDEMALPPGKLRLRREGSSGGQKGLQNIIDRCGGEGFPRLRIGVGGRTHEEMGNADHVLEVLRGKDLDELHAAAVRAAECVECVVLDGIDAAMSRFN